MDTCQVHEYPDSSISNVLTALKWRMITTLNRKLLEKQRIKNRFASYEVHIGHLFCNVNAAVRNHLTLSTFRFKTFSTRLTDKLTKKLTDKQNQLLNPFTHACAGCKVSLRIPSFVNYVPYCMQRQAGATNKLVYLLYGRETMVAY